jgi:4-diphosphocytidyl-2-C-methyl-D-erythritol kinase
MIRAARVQAQAKINLSLRVLEREADGYHALVTHFHRVDLADEVLVRAGGSTRALRCAGPRMPAEGLGPPEKNLAFRAAVEFANRAGWPDGFEIEIDKRIPVGGGLGGGSADAAAVLRALNALAPKPLSPQEIWTSACALGSDVPFLAGEHLRAIAEGRGTDLAYVFDETSYARYRMVIVVPPFSVSTADAYRWLDEDRARRGQTGPDPLEPIEPITMIPNKDDVRRAMEDATNNDFEPVVEARHPEIRRIRDRLVQRGAELARLAGSGSCVFALFRDLPPTTLDLDFETQLIPTRLSSKVVQVEVLE